MMMAFIKTHLECDDCGSSDARSVDDAGWSHCFSCDTRKPVSSNAPETLSKPLSATKASKMIDATTFPAIASRGLTGASNRTYQCATQSNGETVFNYCNADGVVVAQKIRTPEKDFRVSGDWSDALLYGQHLFSKGGKFVTVCEGEFDAIAAYQMMGSKWAAVSVKNGAASALKDCKKQFEWLNSYENIVICFDNDEAGIRASNQVAELFGNKAKVFRGKRNRKDACDYLVAGEEKEFNDTWWSADQYVPDGIIQGSTLLDEVMRPIEPSDVSYPFYELNKLTYGIRKGELVTITAGSGLGKSQFVREIIWHVLNKTEDNIGLLFLEESTRRTGLSIMSLAANKPLHLPDSRATDDEKLEAYDKTLGTDRIYLFDHFGSTSVDNIINRVRYLAKALGCYYIFLDHISIVVSAQGSGDERKAIDEIMTRLRMLVQETGVALICVSHLRRPEGKGHEEGSVTSLSQLRGSGSIAQLSDMVLGLERNGQADDVITRNTTKVRVLKNRFSGITGSAGQLLYNHESGRMTEYHEEDEL
jgi:twinkle protein